MTAPTAGEVVRRALAGSVARLREQEPVIRDDDAEGVHRARVATRHLRSDLRVFAPLLRPGWATGIREELRWLATAFGVARDADVLLDRFTLQAGRWTPAERADAEPMFEALRELDAGAHRTLLAVLAGERYADLVARLEVETAAPPLVLDDAGSDPGSILRPLLAAPVSSFAGAVLRAEVKGTDRRWHRVRIEAKHVRYAAEAVAPAVPEADALALAAEALQDRLGMHQDAVVARRWLRRYGLGALAARERAAADAALSEAPALVDAVLAHREVAS